MSKLLLYICLWIWALVVASITNNSFGCVVLHISFALGSIPAGVSSDVALFAIWYEYGNFV